MPSNGEEMRHLSWPQLVWRYRLQFQSLAAACMICIAGGMKLAWSVFEPPAGRFLSNSSTHLLMVAWFVGVMLGAILASTFVQHISKNVAYCGSGVLLLCGGLLFVCLPTQFPALIASCICEGCSYGLTQLQALVTGAEVAHRGIRGLLLSSLRTSYWLGICLQLLYARWWLSLESAGGHVWHLDQLHGFAVGCLGLAAIVLALLHRYESPLLLLRQKPQELAASSALQHLLHSHFPTQQEAAEASEDFKLLLAQDAGMGLWRCFWQCNALTLLKLTCMRCFAVLSVTLPFNRAFLTASAHGFSSCKYNCLHLMALCGLLGSMTGGWLVDRHGRRRITVVGLLLAGIFIFIVGGLLRQLQTSQKMLSALDFEVASSFMLFHQFAICGGISVGSTVYAAEAFTLRMKAKCLAALLVCEQLVQILMIALLLGEHFSNAAFFFGTGSLCLLLGLLVFATMPETKGLPLSACLVKFTKLPRII